MTGKLRQICMIALFRLLNIILKGRCVFTESRIYDSVGPLIGFIDKINLKAKRDALCH